MPEPFFCPLKCNPPALTRGYISLLSTAISLLSDSVHSTHEITKNTQPAHITLLSKDEYREYSSNPQTTRFEDIDTSKIYPVGVANKKDIWFIPVVWNAGNVWRVKNGFGTKDFHVTLSEGDDHNIDKSVYTIRSRDSEGTEVNGVSLPEGLDVEVLDQLYLYSHLRGDDISCQILWTEYIITTHPASERGYLRLADLAYKQQWYKIAMLSYHAAFAESVNEDGTQKRQDYYTKKIVSCGEHTEFGPLFTEEEAKFLTAAIASQSIQKTLSKPWNSLLTLPCIPNPKRTDPRTRYQTLYPPTTLPRFFSWLIPFHLAAMSTPRSASDITNLHTTLGITHIITLTSETPLPRSWFPPGLNIRNTFIPIENYHPPTVHQLDRILSLILSEPHHNPSIPGCTLIHCGGGKGRAGTILTCYHSLFAFAPNPSPSTPLHTPASSLALIRHIRPGSVETLQQEQFITSYVSTAWKRHGQNQPLIGDGGEVFEPVGKPLEIHGDITNPDMIMLVGLPGSGKSSFAALCRLRSSSIVYVSPDAVVAESGVSIGAARAVCEGVVSHFRGGKKVLLLDRCNPTREERGVWRGLCTGKIVAVWFDIESGVCIARGENRGGHETLKPWRVRGVVEGMERIMEAPKVGEGFSGVVRVCGVDAARGLADRWFGEVGVRKFPRTRHLLDLGSATRDDLGITSRTLVDVANASVIPPQDLALRYFGRQVTVEEKVDGANLGFSLSASRQILVQNRSHYISSSDQAQFGKLDVWLSTHSAHLRRVLGHDPVLPERFVLYGEWMAATHTVVYDRLPDYFLAFDLYDRLNGVFASEEVLRGVLAGTGICTVPVLYSGVLEGEEMLRGFLERGSLFSSVDKVEGVVVRWEDGERGKVVRTDFISGAHWSKGVYRRNEVVREGVSDGL